MKKQENLLFEAYEIWEYDFQTKTFIRLIRTCTSYKAAKVHLECSRYVGDKSEVIVEQKRTLITF